MVIFDNGGGCKNIVKGFGLSGMEKRVSAMNGTIGFNSDGENGFIIRVELPYGRE
jgi:signal transduction histidine kinase